MLHYRKIDFEADVKEIVQLLRTSLSERHTEEFFLWKHYHNPFGESYGLLACDKEKIVGVRMFMFWEFEKEGEIVKAIRPVDTITHPDYRGKGIFKKITFMGLEECEGKYDLIFNTPNKNSLPGYLKMGWSEFNHSHNYFIGCVFAVGKAKGEVMSVGNLENNLPNVNNEFWNTNKTIDFLKWRYSDDDYKCFKQSNNKSLLIYKKTLIKGIKTIVLCDYVGSESELKKAIKSLCIKERTFFCYYLNTISKELSFLFSFKRNNSVVVYKDDNLNISEKISFSLGDLESIM